MKEIEPQLEPELHDRVTQLLAELTAFDVMQSLNMMQTLGQFPNFEDSIFPKNDKVAKNMKSLSCL